MNQIERDIKGALDQVQIKKYKHTLPRRNNFSLHIRKQYNQLYQLASFIKKYLQEKELILKDKITFIKANKHLNKEEHLIHMLPLEISSKIEHDRIIALITQLETKIRIQLDKDHSSYHIKYTENDEIKFSNNKTMITNITNSHFQNIGSTNSSDMKYNPLIGFDPYWKQIYEFKSDILQEDIIDFLSSPPYDLVK
ncbi:hypothetical protein RhiirA5_433685 [Rhizophagus irregularis]|uniref:Uncharacterized protein n=1 Tax=Rhizophagus irregularis TaxID=588596 RepID=A0A2N0NRC3_9GLOM|nr:hypothetical protein RhiirA5_433685 [Rhizophagus irregularis]